VDGGAALLHIMQPIQRRSSPPKDDVRKALQTWSLCPHLQCGKGYCPRRMIRRKSRAAPDIRVSFVARRERRQKRQRERF